MRLLTRDETERAIAFMRERSWTGGLLVMVRPSDYGLTGERWCRVDRVSPGDASVYPIKVDFEPHGRGRGQYKLGEIIAARLSAEGVEDTELGRAIDG